MLKGTDNSPLDYDFTPEKKQTEIRTQVAKLDNNQTRAKMEETLKYAEDKKACMLSWIEGLGVIEKRLAEYFCENAFTYVDCFQFLISCDTEFQVSSLLQALKLDQLLAKDHMNFPGN